MQVRTPGRTVLSAVAAAAAVALLAGCSGSGSAGASSAATAGRTVAPSQAAAEAAASSAAAAPSTPAASSDPFVSPSRDSESPVGADGRNLPNSTARAAAGVGFVAVTPELAKRLAVVTKSVGTLVSGSQVRGVSLASKPVGAIAVYTVAPSAAKSTQFQDQFAVQLLTTLGADSNPRFVRVKGHAVAVSQGKTPAAAWFDGNRAVVLIREGSSASVEALAGSLIGRSAS